jgi:hypothetical protein
MGDTPRLFALLGRRFRIRMTGRREAIAMESRCISHFRKAACAISDAPLGAYRNRYKYLMAKIERLCFSSGQEWRKFLQIVEGLEWQQCGGCSLI